MKEKNKFFARAFDWLYQHGMATDQTDIARTVGISKTTVSRIMNHGVGRPDEKTIRKFNDAFGNIFNPDFLRGQSEVMLMSELSACSTTVVTDLHGLSPDLPNYPSLDNATIAAKDDAIEAAKREAAAKDETIASLKREVASKESYIKSLEQQVQDLRAQLAQQKMKDMVGGHPFPIGAAEDGNRPTTTAK